LLGIATWTVDDKEIKAREYRKLQQDYIHKMVGDLKDRICKGDQTPSILGNMLRQGTLSEEEVLLASYTGSKSHLEDFRML
jgi:phenylacetate 2-hydroxylase